MSTDVCRWCDWHGLDDARKSLCHLELYEERLWERHDEHGLRELSLARRRRRDRRELVPLADRFWYLCGHTVWNREVRGDEGRRVRSRRPVVLWCLHFFNTTRVHQTRSWVLSFSSLRPFGHRDAPRRLRSSTCSSVCATTPTPSALLKMLP